MTPTLYFLRSSENKIVENMLQYAHPNLDDTTIYSKFYGLTSKDLGLYALVDNKITGAIWSRILKDETIPTLSLAILPEFRNQGIATSMMQQFLLEAAVIFDELKVDSYNNEALINFLKNFGFTQIEDSSLLTKTLEKKELVRPTDGYDANKWMD